MKIVISANTSWYLYNFRQNTIKALVKQGYQVFAVAPKDSYSDKLESLGCKWSDISIDQSGTNPIRDMLTCISFYKLYKKLNPDVVLNFTPKNNIYSTLASSFLRVPCVNNIAGLGKMFTENSLPSKLAKVLYKHTQKRAAKVFFQNDEDRKLFIDNKFVNSNKTERLFGSGIDLKRFIVTQRKDDGVIRFLLVARLLKQKGVYEYASAARAIKEQFTDMVDFRLLGFLDEENPNSILKRDLDRWVSEGLINYIGISDNVEHQIQQVDCMVLPSFYREGVPKSLLEGLGSGKPIITTDNIGCRETVIEGENGYLCEPKNVTSLVEKIKRFVELSDEAKVIMGLKSRQLAENKFDEKLVIDSYLNAIEEIIGIKKN